MNQIMKNEELNTSELLDCFLLISDHAQYSEAKKQADAMLPKRDFRQTISRRSIENNLEPLDLEKLETKEGQIDIKISPYLKKFYKEYQPLADLKKSHISKLCDLSKDLYKSLQNVEKVYSDMAKVCAGLHHAAAEYNQENKNSEDELLEKTFFALQNNFICMGEVYRRESRTSKDVLYSLFHIWKKDLQVFEEVIKLRQQVNEEYLTFKTELKDRKQRLLNSKEKVEFDELTLKYSCLAKTDEEFNRVKHKFMLPEVGFLNTANKACQKVG